MPEHKTSPSGEIELFATAPPPSTKPKKKKKRKKFADWYDNEIAAVLDDEEPNNRSQTDGSCCEYNDDDDSSSSDYSEGLALLQSSLDTLEIDEETNHRHMFSCCGFWWHRMWNCHWLGSTDLRFSIRKEDEEVFAVGGRGILEVFDGTIQCSIEVGEPIVRFVHLVTACGCTQVFLDVSHHCVIDVPDVASR